MKRKFKREFLVEDLGLPYNAIEDKIYDTGRWSTYHSIVFEHDGKFYSTSYSEGSTEMQCERPWEYEDEVECIEVEKRNVSVEKYVSIDKPVEDDKPTFDKAKQSVYETDYRIESDLDAEKMVKLISELKEQNVKLIEVCKQQIAEYQSKIDFYEEETANMVNPIQEQLFNWMQNQEVKETKTQYSYKLPSATLKYTKAKADYSKDDAKLLEWVKGNREDLVKVKESVDWATLKKELNIFEDKAVTIDGEIVEGIKIVEKAGKFEIK